MDVMAATEILARSTTLTGVGAIGYIIIGGLAGWLASKIVSGGGSGILLDIVIGIVGALLGGFILSFFVQHRGRRPNLHLLHRPAWLGDPALARQDGAKGLTPWPRAN